MKLRHVTSSLPRVTVGSPPLLEMIRVSRSEASRVEEVSIPGSVRELRRLLQSVREPSSRRIWIFVLASEDWCFTF